MRHGTEQRINSQFKLAQIRRIDLHNRSFQQHKYIETYVHVDIDSYRHRLATVTSLRTEWFVALALQKSHNSKHPVHEVPNDEHGMKSKLLPV